MTQCFLERSWSAGYFHKNYQLFWFNLLAVKNYRLSSVLDMLSNCFKLVSLHYLVILNTLLLLLLLLLKNYNFLLDSTLRDIYLKIYIIYQWGSVRFWLNHKNIYKYWPPACCCCLHEEISRWRAKRQIFYFYIYSRRITQFIHQTWTCRYY